MLPTAKVIALVFIGTQLPMMLSTLDTTIVATALPSIVDDLGGGALRTWVITAYQLAIVAVTPLYGKLGDLYGRKRIFLTAIVLFSAGSVACGAARSIEQLIAFRVLKGLGGGGFGAVGMAILADIIPARKLGRWLGYQGAVFSVAMLAGPLVGGLFVTHLSWRWAFYVNLPLAVAAVAVIASQLRVPYRRVPHRLDVPGALLVTSALATLVLLLTLGGRTVPWLSGTTALLAAAVAALFGAFVACERRAAEPIVPPRLLGLPVVRVSMLINLTSGVALAAGIYEIPVWVQKVAGGDATQSGLLLVPLMVTTAFGTFVAGKFVERTGRYRSWPVVGMAMATGGLCLLALLRVDTPVGWAAVFGLVLGTGIGFTMQTSILAIQNGVDQRDLGVATSSALLSRTLGTTIGATITSTVVIARLGEATDAAAYAGAVPVAFLAVVPIAALGIVAAWRLPHQTLRDDARFA